MICYYSQVPLLKITVVNKFNKRNKIEDIKRTYYATG